MEVRSCLQEPDDGFKRRNPRTIRSPLTTFAWRGLPWRALV